MYLGFSAFTFSGNSADMKELVDTNFQTGALVVVALGVVIILLSGIGFCGACMENTCLLNFYGFLMLLLLIGNGALIYFGFQYRDTFSEKFSQGIQKGINNFGNDQKMAYALQMMQKTFQCCGWEGPKDYSGELPASCCKQEFSTSTATSTCRRSSVEYDVGCKDSPVIQRYFGGIIYSAYAMLLVQLMIILASCCLARDISSNKYYSG